MNDTTLVTRATETAKKHGTKAAGVTSLAAVILAGQAYFAPLAGHNELRHDVQDLRERLGQLEWAHERPARHDASITVTNVGGIVLPTWNPLGYANVATNVNLDAYAWP